MRIGDFLGVVLIFLSSRQVVWGAVRVASSSSSSSNNIHAGAARSSNAFSGRHRLRRAPWTTVVSTVRGGGGGGGGGGGADHNPQEEQLQNEEEEEASSSLSTVKNATATLENYVAAMEERDAQMQHDSIGGGTNNSNNNDDDDDNSEKESSSSSSASSEDAVLGLRQHHHHHKKSNAVGDPDSDSDDDDDTTSEEITSDMDQAVEWEERYNTIPQQQQQVQVKVELVDAAAAAADPLTKTSSSTGGGVRLGRRSKQTKRQSSKLVALRKAWLSHVYLPRTLPTQHKSMVDGGNLRLDRRTLYASLLQEWQSSSSQSSRRKFLSSTTSQALQASLSLATQPAWRQALISSSLVNGIMLYDNDDHSSPPTLAMQETIAMALAHSLRCGMVILDDEVVDNVKSQFKDDTKTIALLESLLATNAGGGKSSSSGGACISNLMKRDLQQELDDPFDERALESIEKMREWEQSQQDDDEEEESSAAEELPLVVFVRTSAAQNLLKSKTAMEYLQQSCGETGSVHLLVLGKGIDAHTKYLPPPPAAATAESLQQQQQQLHSELPQFTPGDGRNPPWFGFSPQNQNASGVNDPDGSRRFNIFLARTIDANGTPGILGAIAPPQAGNLFPHMMAMHARERLQQQQQQQSGGDASDQDMSSPFGAQLEQWAQLLQQHMQNGGPSPQFFNASLTPSVPSFPSLPQQQSLPPPPEVVQALKQAMTELTDRLAEMAPDEDGAGEESDLHKAFAQVLQNENLRRSIAENLANAAPSLSDPKCQGVMLSVYVPPPPSHMNRDQLPMNTKPPGGWFQKILHPNDEDDSEEDSSSNKKDRVRTLAAAMAISKESSPSDAKAERNLAKLESNCKRIPIQTPSDPVRQKSWEAWIARERGSVLFRQNRLALNEELALRRLSLEQHTGTHGAGSALRQMLSVRDISDDMEDVIKCAVELEAAKSRRQQETDGAVSEKDLNLEVDVSLSQLLLTEDGRVEEMVSTLPRKKQRSGVKLLHPSSLETALSLICRISPSPSGGLSLSSTPASHRSREDIAALAQDKHERALISQVVSPQDIGVTYDMIGGLSDVKELLRQSITYPLKFPHLYSEGIAREAVKGVLLFGPPGTGKTMLAKAVATEGGASFLSVDASSVENKWLGESEKNAKAVFTLARRLAPCVIFIDEVDSLLSSREGSSDDSAHGTLTSVKTTMMSEWDGLNSGTNGLGEAGSDRVVVIGSTNRPFDLDEAVLRRFPRRILVDLPDMETRKEILEVTLAENRLDPSVNLTQIAERLEGYTGSDIKEVCREAVVQISHEQARLLDQGGLSSLGKGVTQGMLQRLRPVTMEDFEKALGKLKRSVSEKGRELARVWEWNDEYGEIKKDNKNHLPQLMNMYL